MVNPCLDPSLNCDDDDDDGDNDDDDGDQRRRNRRGRTKRRLIQHSDASEQHARSYGMMLMSKIMKILEDFLAMEVYIYIYVCICMYVYILYI